MPCNGSVKLRMLDFGSVTVPPENCGRQRLSRWHGRSCCANYGPYFHDPLRKRILPSQAKDRRKEILTQKIGNPGRMGWEMGLIHPHPPGLGGGPPLTTHCGRPDPHSALPSGADKGNRAVIRAPPPAWTRAFSSWPMPPSSRRRSAAILKAPGGGPRNTPRRRCTARGRPMRWRTGRAGHTPELTVALVAAGRQHSKGRCGLC